MANASLLKVTKNMTKMFVFTPRITLSFSIKGRQHSDTPRTSEMSQEDCSKEKEGVKDPYAAFPDNVNPETGEKGGPKGPEPTRYGDWERKGRCIDF